MKFKYLIKHNEKDSLTFGVDTLQEVQEFFLGTDVRIKGSDRMENWSVYENVQHKGNDLKKLMAVLMARQEMTELIRRKL